MILQIFPERKSWISLHVVDDRRIWLIAEAIRQGISYEEIHAITQIDLWFIDKIAILVEMEQALKSEPLTPELLKEAKRIEFPDNVDCPPDRQDGGGDQRAALRQRHHALYTRW